ncbi:oligosaccharide flippase family protein [Flavihumibacter solisilvae]|uniref:Polysaccharide biosynthesis protein C-terminal domain-containing protein n=1 Tax=Flavihumibacter solisilvae TaxID=1349421 RepID=A0A0C1L3W0_9BACT|nr:oligosaccharide flippase family protein [Flavihumibacter solisilvae]KIC94311.1 hypothetical protein OI18_11790 [Flavihumibacter solisilvae]
MGMNKILGALTGKGLLQNSLWGMLSNILQNFFLGLFFIIVARSYSVGDFADYLVANTMYQLIASFSTMGLGQWFTREIINSEDKRGIVNRFLKLQLYFGVAFYLVNCVAAYTMYDDPMIRKLAVYVGINILFDNFIYALRSLNIAERNQQKSFMVLLIESSLKLLLGTILVFQSFSIVALSVLSVVLRVVTLNLFIRISSSSLLTLRGILRYRISFDDIRQIVFKNWAFVVIGSISVIYWRVGSIIISKMLTDLDIANYEIGYKLFSIAQIIPVIFSATVFPKFVSMAGTDDRKGLTDFFRFTFIGYFLFGLLSCTFVYSFSDLLVPFAFGEKFAASGPYVREMFFTMLVFPTALLQANLLVAIKLEKFDMLFNVLSLVVYLGLCLTILSGVRSLSVVNYSILASFFFFHLLQDIALYRKGMLSVQHIVLYYLALAGIVLIYYWLCQVTNAPLAFVLFWGGVALLAVIALARNGLSMHELRNRLSTFNK